VLGSVWTGRLAVLAGAGAFGLIVYQTPPTATWPWAQLALLCFAPPIVLIALTYWLIGRGNICCTYCNLLTRSSPRPTMRAGMSEPHLRCGRCGTIIPGV